MVAVSRTESVADGATDTFPISFPYLAEDHVFVFTKAPGEAALTQYTEGFTFTSPSMIQLNTTPANGTVVSRRRVTPNDDLLAFLEAPSTVSDEELNLVHTQLLYLIQENLDASLGLADEGILDILTNLRFTYDIILSGPAQFEGGDVIGPVPVTEAISIAIDAAGSEFAGPLVRPVSDHVITVYKADADGSNETALGTVTITPAGVVTPDFPAISTLAKGNIIYGKTTTAGNGMFNFGMTIRAFRL